MTDKCRNELISSLAEVLAGVEVESASVLRALEIICSAAEFDCAGVYGMDSTGQLCLMERYPPTSETMNGKFPSTQLVPDDSALEPQTVYCMSRELADSPAELSVLDLFAAQSLALAPMWDENQCAYGFVVLLDRSGEHAEMVDSESLAAPLSMLVHYVGARMYKTKLEQAQTALESVLDNTGIDIYVNDFYNHDILYVNRSMAAPYGGKQQFMGQKCWSVLFPGQQGPCEFCPQNKLIDEQGMPTKVYTWDYQRGFDGSWFRVFSAAFRWGDGRLAHVVSSADITDNKRNEAMIENLANYDQLTKLPNRRMLLKECERRIETATEIEQGYLLFFDIDGFKSINDQYGHDAGDEFLIQLGEFFSGIPLLKNAIYRNGGDEFVAIIGGEGVTKDNIRSLASFIHRRFESPWVLKKGDARCNASIGVACYPEDGNAPETLLQKADMAMYKAKKSGGGRICFGYELEETPKAVREETCN